MKFAGAIFILTGFLVAISSCTYSVIMTPTQGNARDDITEGQEANPNISPKLNIPVKP